MTKYGVTDLHLMLHRMASKLCVVGLQVQLEVYVQAVVLQEGGCCSSIIVVLVLGGFLDSPGSSALVTENHANCNLRF